MLKKALKPFTERKTKISDLEKRLQGEPSKDVTDTWCPLPWLGLSVRSVGDLRYCCHAHSSPGRGVLTDEKGEALNLKDHSFALGKNAPLLKDVRKAMLKGDRHQGCNRCYREEDAGIFSRRQSEQVTWQERNYDLFKNHTHEDGTIDEERFPLRYLDLRFGNRCNLKCRMCGPTESDKWYELTPKVWGTPQFKEGDRWLTVEKNEKGQYGLNIDPYQWYESPKFWKELEIYLPKLQRIYLAGGEPLLIETQFEFLQLCIDKGYAKNIILEYNSNITALTPKILEIWSHFRKVEIGMSVDGVGPINDYIRTGSKWEKIEKNLKDLDTAPGQFKLWWACTIQIYNLLQVPDMMRWIINQKFERINQSKVAREIMTPHPLTNPNFLAITTFPEKSKNKIREIFEYEKSVISDEIYGLDFYGSNEYFRYERLVKRFQSILDNYTNILFSKNDDHLKEKFWTYTNNLDEIHGTKFKDVAPETYELML